MKKNLKKLNKGTIILNSKLTSFEEIVDEVVNDFIDRGYVGRDNKEFLKSIILSQHRSQHSMAGNLTDQKAPLSELYSSNYKHSRLAGSHSYSENLANMIHFRKNSSSAILNPRLQKIKSDEFSNLNEQQNLVCEILKKIKKFTFIISITKFLESKIFNWLCTRFTRTRIK